MTDLKSDPNAGSAATVASTEGGATPEAEPDLAPNEIVGEYTIVDKLGEGGFGKVFRAVHPVIGKQVAIKVLNRTFSADPAMVSRFSAEARAVNQIRHRNIIDIFSFGKLPDGRQYYVMELLTGIGLDQYLVQHGGKLACEHALPLLRDIARALDAAHGKGIAHRDLKPENVFVADDDGTPFPKLLDFGIAKLLGNDNRQHKTRTGAPMGTPLFMSPEQCRGKDVDHRTDIYSFGIMTYQVLTGQLPFRGDDFVEIIMKQTQATAVPPSRVAGLPPALDAPIQHMLEKDPANRPQNLMTAMTALYEALGMALPARAMLSTRSIAPGLHSASAYPTPSPSAIGSVAAPTLVGPPKSKKLVIAVVAALVVAAGVVTVVMITNKSEPAISQAPMPPAPDPKPAVDPPKPAPEPPRPAPEPPAQPTTVELEITDAPKGTQVYGPGNVLLGTAPGKLTVPRGDQPYELTLKKPGYKPRVEKVTVTASTKIALPLVRIQVKRPGSGSSDIPDF